MSWKTKIRKIRKIPVRKFDERTIRQCLSYTKQEVSKVLGVTELTIQRWQREEGLISIDNRRPAMFHWSVLKQFIKFKNHSYKTPKGNPGEIFCVKCQIKRRCYKNEILVEKVNDVLSRFVSFCEYCGTKMNVMVGASNVSVSIKSFNYKIVQELDVNTLIPNSNCSSRSMFKEKQKFELVNSIKINSQNERMKHEYFSKIKEIEGYDEKTKRLVVYALERFEEFTDYKCFKLFNYDTALNFKEYTKENQKSIRTAYNTLKYTMKFLKWLKYKPGYKKIDIDAIDALKLSLKEMAKVNTNIQKDIIPLEIIENKTLGIGQTNNKSFRIKALLSLLLRSGARIDSAIKTKIGDLNLQLDYVYQPDPKTGRPQKTDLLEFQPEIMKILPEWIDFLKTKYHFTDADPLFPAINNTFDKCSQYNADGFKKKSITPKAVSNELKELLPEYNFTPHMAKHSLIHFVLDSNPTIEQQKAFSQNVGHKNMSTTINSYYTIQDNRKTQLVQELSIEDMKIQKELKKMPEFNCLMSKLKDKANIRTALMALMNSENDV